MNKPIPSLGKISNVTVCRTAVAISLVAPAARGDLPSRFVDAMATIAGNHPNSSFWATALNKMKFLEMEANRKPRAFPRGDH